MPEFESLEPFIKGIQQTGYPFEYRTVRLLSKHGWSVISNRYYVDHENQLPREIDALAYKVAITENLEVVTALFVSCKKSDHSAWTVLSRAADLNDANVNWQPAHIFSDSFSLDYLLSKRNEFEQEYYRQAQSADQASALQNLTFDVFAFQEMSYLDKGRSGKMLEVAQVKNDSTIFSSIMSLMKAQAYELKARRNGKKDRRILKPRVYQFNLLSACSLDFIQLAFEGDEIKAERLQAFPYVARYLIDGTESTSRIIFSNEERLPQVIDAFDRLHDFNKEYFVKLESKFYEDVFEDTAKKGYLSKIFFKALENSSAFPTIEGKTRRIQLPPSGFIYHDLEKETVQISFDGIHEEIAAAMNNDARLLEKIKNELDRVFRYKGAFEIVDSLF